LNERSAIWSAGILPASRRSVLKRRILGPRDYSRFALRRTGCPRSAKAGLRAGDRIVKMAGREVKNVYDYTYRWVR